MTLYVFVPSPFVGANSFIAMAHTLPDAIIVDYGGLSGPDWYEGAARRIAVQADRRPWLAVLHSGAGGFAPALAAMSENLAGFVFLDAVLPYPGKSCLENAPPELASRLRRLVTDGRLAPWNEWFGRDPTLTLLPDPATRAAFLSDIPHVPWAFMQAISPTDASWERLPAAYVQLSSLYGDTADQAEQMGWPVRRADLNHLAMASDPDAVAALLTDLPLADVGAGG
jgi:hypothetical protein